MGAASKNRLTQVMSWLACILALFSFRFLTAWVLVIGFGLYVWANARRELPGSKNRMRVLIAAIWGTLSIVGSIAFSVHDFDRLPSEVWCGERMRALRLQIDFYLLENEGQVFPVSQWCDIAEPIRDAVMDPDMFRCPGRLNPAGHINIIEVRFIYEFRNRHAGDGPCDYALNEFVGSTRMEDLPEDMVFMFESNAGWNQVGSAEILTSNAHGGKGCNIVFVNGNTRFVRSEKLQDLKWKK